MPVAGSQKYQILILFELYPVRTIPFGVILKVIVLSEYASNDKILTVRTK